MDGPFDRDRQEGTEQAHHQEQVRAAAVFRMTLVPDEHENQAGDRDQQIGKDVDRAQYGSHKGPDVVLRLKTLEPLDDIVRARIGARALIQARVRLSHQL
jgi:hypothetical protein